MISHHKNHKNLMDIKLFAFDYRDLNKQKLFVDRDQHFTNAIRLICSRLHKKEDFKNGVLVRFNVWESNWIAIYDSHLQHDRDNLLYHVDVCCEVSETTLVFAFNCSLFFVFCYCKTVRIGGLLGPYFLLLISTNRH